MNIGYVFLVIMASAAFFVSGIPTPDQMNADFNSAQKFYASGAYDQAIEMYEEVGSVESRFIDEDNVIVEFSEMQIRIKDATLYQTGNSFLKMVEAELDKVRDDSDAYSDEDKEKAQALALEYVNNASESFKVTQDQSTNDELKVLAQKRNIDVWYLVNDYNKVIEEGRTLIERYPESIYVQDALYNIGWAYYDTKRFDECIETFSELVNRFPTGNKADRSLFQIGESYFDQEQYDEAVPFYQRLVDKMRIDELTELEIQKIQRDKIAGLTDETALELAAKAALKIGACHGNSGDYDKAETSYKRVAALFKFDKNLIYQAYSSLADMYYDLGDFDQSIQSYRDAIDEVPDKILSAKMQVLICQRYFEGTDETKYYENAITEYNNYINNYSDVAFRAGFDLDEAYLMLARSYYEQGSNLLRIDQRELGVENLDQSISTFQRLLVDFPETDLTERVYFRMGISYQENGSDEYLTNAISNYDRLLEEFPETPYREYAYGKLARSYRNLKDYDKAISQFKTLIAEFPESDLLDSAWFEMGISMTEKGDELGAVPYLSNVSRENKNLYTTARLLSAQTLFKENRDSEVVDVLTVAMQDTDSIESVYRLSQFYIMRGNAYKRLEDFDAALADYTTAHDLDQPATREMASVQRAGVYIDQQQFARAESDLRELMKSDDESIRKSAEIRLAFISVRLGNSTQAIETYFNLYNSTEDVDEKLGYLRNLIQLNAESKDWDGLQKYVNMMLDSDDAEGQKPEGQEAYYKEEAYYFLGNSFETQGLENEDESLPTPAASPAAQQSYSDAIFNLNKGYEEFSDSYFSSDMLLKIGVLYLTKMVTMEDARDLAAESFQKYITQFPNTPNTYMAHYYMGFCYYNGRRFTEAIKTFRDYERLYPDSEFAPEAVFYYSDGEYNVGNLNESIAGFDRMISKYPNHEKAAEALYTKAWAYLDLESEDDAIASFQLLVDRFPDSEFASTSLFSIADYYYNIQDYENAITNYEDVLAKYPETEVAQKVPETLKDLTETVAYIEYEKGWNLFVQAQEAEDNNLFRQAADIFKNIYEKYPETESEIGALSNAGICYEALNLWFDAIDVYDMVMLKYEEGADVSLEAYNFSRLHKAYIEANRL
jgi:TolA-binding protein/Tfp pilus assembly protein PilF